MTFWTESGEWNSNIIGAGSSVFTYSCQGLNILYEKNGTGTTTTITKHFYVGGLQVAKMVGTGVYYLHQDAPGGTRLETTNTVLVKFSSNYVPYGNNYAMTGKDAIMHTGDKSEPPSMNLACARGPPNFIASRKLLK